MIDKRLILTTNSLLSGLPVDVVEQLLAVSSLKQLADGECVYAQGDVGDGLLGVVEGRIRLSNSSRDGKELLVMLVEPGDWIGEVSLFDGLPRSQDAFAVGDCSILFLPKAKFDALLNAKPELYQYFVPMLCRKLRLALSYVESVALYSLPARLAQRLLELLNFYGVDDGKLGHLIDVHLPQEDLAKMLGVSRQAVSRELKRLEADGVIQLAYGQLRILDKAALKLELDRA
ncbi:CRP-like cAMP-activated global transcriptional regulator [Zhongshania aliphaticivorans]|uniref:CRP-like cAMP-activated global transcriptional regulator n=1 Tax=Zhongshania aliphaticivorans TaxID=1470434 RepID=A0A5S9PYN5_9GAMM|nr:Crp/Fnr family transcriptional regulator [Zhongshania aliphaticivorans]CAA0092316.1 CRP-like cAMP-activated global transcriptional regulator [Zhongshania aliphaticivorans]CAA0109546.1 CRP-like cAMP-activated global transcriptional regulator [Zhongshania aliphaticivorans]